MNNITITTKKRIGDWMAYLNGDERFWDCGETEAEAIGKLFILAKSARYFNNVTIIHDKHQELNEVSK